MRNRPIAFYSKKKQIFKIDVGYEEGENPVEKLRDFLKHLNSLRGTNTEVSGLFELFDVEMKFYE